MLRVRAVVMRAAGNGAPEFVGHLATEQAPLPTCDSMQARRRLCGGLRLRRDPSVRFAQYLLVDLADARLCQTVDEPDLLGDTEFRDDAFRRERLQMRLDIGFLQARTVIAVLDDQRERPFPPLF